MGKKKRMIFMTKKRFFSFLVLLVAVVAFMLIPKGVEDNMEETQDTTAQSSEANNENETNEEQEVEPIDGIKIGVSNLIVLIGLGTVLAINKFKDIRVEQSQEKD